MGSTDPPQPAASPPQPEPPWHDRRLWHIRPVQDLFWIVVAVTVTVGALWLGYALRSIFTPVLIALALAYLFQPIIRFGEHQTRLSRPAVIGLLMAGLTLLGLALLAWLGPQFVRQLTDLARAVPGYLATLAEMYAFDLGDLEAEARAWADEIQADPGGTIVSALGVLFAGTTHVFGVIGQVIGTGVYVTVSVLLIGVYFFFFAWHFDAILRYFLPFIPASKRELALEILGKMDAAVSAFFRSRVIIALIMGAMFSLGWAIVGVPYWFLLGMGTGLLSIVPFVSLLGWPAAVGLMWLHAVAGGGTGANGEAAEAAVAGADLWTIVFWPSFVYLLVQGLESWVLTPVIQGHSLNMSVVTIMLVIFVGGALGGLYGLILCIPLAACAKILLHEIIVPRLQTWAAAN